MEREKMADEIDAWLARKGRNLPVAMDEDELAELAAEMREDTLMGLGATEDDYIEHDPGDADEFDLDDWDGEYDDDGEDDPGDADEFDLE
jgi:hypothetical protein